MGRLQSSFLIFICITISVTGDCFAQKYDQSFYGEETFQDAVSIPPSVLAAIERDWQINGCRNPKTGEPFSHGWFEATYIDLNRDRYEDLLVKAKDPNGCFNGNAVSFWVFRNAGGKFNRVFSDYTLTVEITKMVSNWHFGLRTGRCSASICFNKLFTFNGQEYVLKREWEEPLKPVK
jgi:hypothetical protein